MKKKLICPAGSMDVKNSIMEELLDLIENQQSRWKTAPEKLMEKQAASAAPSYAFNAPERKNLTGKRRQGENHGNLPSIMPEKEFR